MADFIGSINLLEGRVAYETDDFVAVLCPELESELRIDHGPSVQEGQKVWVAIRPEKIAIRPDSGGALPAGNAVRGVVEGLGYLGSETIYRVRLDGNGDGGAAGGRMIEATAPNLTRSARRAVDWDDPVVLTWDSAAGVVLTS